MDMRELTRLEEQEIVDYDVRHFQPWNNRNRTRFYKYLTLNGDDVEIRTVACRWGKGHYATRPIVMKEIARTSVDTASIFTRDVAFYQVSGYCVDWSSEGLSIKHEWQVAGWHDTPYKASSSLWKINNKPVINPEILQKTDRFKYCSWTPECGEIIDYLKVYASHPRVEFLVKSGLKRFACKSGFIAQMEKNKGLIMDNMMEIQKFHYGADVIRMAYSKKISLIDADNRIADRRHFHGYSLPREIDPSKAIAYMKKQKDCYTHTYVQYLRDCKYLGLDLSDTKVALPHNFKTREKEIRALKAVKERREQKEKLMKIQKQIARTAVDAARLESINGPFSVVLPKNDKDLIKEGKKLSHCVGNGVYAERIAEKKLIIAFIRMKSRPSEPLVTVSYDVQAKEVAQVYARKNTKPEKRILDFVYGPFEKTAKKIRLSK